MSDDLVMTRIFDAPRALVYRAFIDPDQLSRWFGPVGFSVPRDSVSIDARVGGHQRFRMIDDANPENSNPPLDITFTEVVENELLCGQADTGMDEFGGAIMRLRLEFHEEPDGRTRLVLTQGPYTPEIADMAREGWESSFTKLDKIL